MYQVKTTKINGEPDRKIARLKYEKKRNDLENVN